MTRREWALVGMSLALAGKGALAERSTYTIGGAGRGWGEVTQYRVALDDTTLPGAIQPEELKPWENIVVGAAPLTNIFGFEWHRGKGGLGVFGRELGLNPRFWIAGGGQPPPEIIDGDERTSSGLLQLVPQEELAQYNTATSSAYEAGIRDVNYEIYTLDLGIPVPVERIRFFPPQQGVDRRGVPNKNDAPQGFEVSVALHPEEFLLLEGESLPWHSLEQVVERTLANSRSIVEVNFPLQAIRFIRLNLSLMPQFYTLAEIQAFGAGFPPITRFTSRAIDFGEPVNFGGISYAFHKFRQAPDGSQREDPQAPARLVLETKSGLDDTPLAYFVVDELGGDREVSQKEYERAPPPRIDRSDLRLPGIRSAIAEDRKTWTPWSSPYSSSGAPNRSADGRRFLQFRFALESDEVMAFGRLDSLSFEYSPLLAAEVLGEISLVRDPASRIAEVLAGREEIFACDIRASFGAPGQAGFDGVRLDVPPGSRFIGLEMGEPLAEVVPDSVAVRERELVVFFPSHPVTAASERPVRIVLGATLLNASAFFTGEVFSLESDDLPQSIEPGDANPAVAANTLQIYAAQPRLRSLAGLEVSPRVMTPNSDGRNDQAQIAFKVMEVEDSQVEIGVFDLQGRQVRRLVVARRGAGSYAEVWDGTDDRGARVVPGIYLCRVAVRTGSGVVEAVQTLAVAH
ncbi:MAG: hypothetical protein HYW07_17475 [Candidatus Latescibacteria bacterium]|nr:hypothetical protein [Candidatus Latescibacterota bacterium]